jgi:hypothetical protein
MGNEGVTYWGIGVSTPTLQANCDFILPFCNFVILPLFYQNEASVCPFFQLRQWDLE